ncbi:MAG: AEC family transporter [Stappiaceae bacterium]
MELLIEHVLNVVAPVLICASIGFILAKTNVLFDTKMVGAVVSKVGYPTLILSHLAQQHVAFGAFVQFMGFAAIAVGLFGVIGFVFLRLVGLPARAFLSPMMMNNVGNVGLPVCLLAFGSQGLAYALAFTVAVLCAIFTVGMWLPIGKVSFKSLLSQPVIYAVILSLILMGTGAQLPEPIIQSASILGGLSIPLMLLTLGYTIATLSVGSIWRGTYLALFHLVMAGAVAFTLVAMFGLTGTEKGVFILQCLAPVSVATYLWVEMYQEKYAADVAGMILISTLATIIVLPLVLTFWI